MNETELLPVEELPEEPTAESTAGEGEKDEVTWRIFKHYGVIGRDKNGWEKELNLVSWNERPARYDIRSWDHAHTRMTKGITLSKEETVALAQLFVTMNVLPAAEKPKKASAKQNAQPEAAAPAGEQAAQPAPKTESDEA